MVDTPESACEYKNPQTDYDTQYKYGLLMNCFVSFYIYYNLLVILYFNFRNWRLILKKSWRLRGLYCCDFRSSRKEDFLAKQRVDERLDGLMRLQHLKISTKKKLFEPSFNEAVE